MLELKRFGKSGWQWYKLYKCKISSHYKLSRPPHLYSTCLQHFYQSILSFFVQKKRKIKRARRRNNSSFDCNTNKNLLTLLKTARRVLLQNIQKTETYIVLAIMSVSSSVFTVTVNLVTIKSKHSVQRRKVEFYLDTFRLKFSRTCLWTDWSIRQLVFILEYVFGKTCDRYILS